jgi:hypothetical protein
MRETERTLEEEREFQEQRRLRIKRDNELISEKIRKRNDRAKELIDIEFRRQCRALQAREEELKERGMRLTKNSPFHTDINAVITSSKEKRQRKERRAAQVAHSRNPIISMIGRPDHDPVTKEVIDGTKSEEVKNALTLRQTRLRVHTLSHEIATLASLNAAEMERINMKFPFVAMQCESNLKAKAEAEREREMVMGSEKERKKGSRPPSARAQLEMSIDTGVGAVK